MVDLITSWRMCCVFVHSLERCRFLCFCWNWLIWTLQYLVAFVLIYYLLSSVSAGSCENRTRALFCCWSPFEITRGSRILGLSLLHGMSRENSFVLESWIRWLVLVVMSVASEGEEVWAVHDTWGHLNHLTMVHKIPGRSSCWCRHKRPRPLYAFDVSLR